MSWANFVFTPTRFGTVQVDGVGVGVAVGEALGPPDALAVGVGVGLELGDGVGVGTVDATGMPSIVPAPIGNAALAVTGIGLPRMFEISGVMRLKRHVMETVTGEPRLIP